MVVKVSTSSIVIHIPMVLERIDQSIWYFLTTSYKSRRCIPPQPHHMHMRILTGTPSGQASGLQHVEHHSTAPQTVRAHVIEHYGMYTKLKLTVSSALNEC
jgi:hypothetical protein